MPVTTTAQRPSNGLHVDSQGRVYLGSRRIPGVNAQQIVQQLHKEGQMFMRVIRTQRYVLWASVALNVVLVVNLIVRLIRR